MESRSPALDGPMATPILSTNPVSKLMLLALGAVVALLSLAPAGADASSTTTLVSRQSDSDGGAAVTDNANEVAISADGRYVAFMSDDDNLSTLDDNIVRNVFLRDTQTNTTISISRQSNSDGGAGADANAGEPSVSSDGRYVAFSSGADNLSTLDDDSVQNIFVRDTQTNTTTLVSRQSAGDGGAGADGFSNEPSISADGRYVTFHSFSANLSAVDDDSVQNLFRRDTVADNTALVSQQSAADGGAGADDNSYNATMSTDGRYVAFVSEADNLSTADNDGPMNAFVRDMVTDVVTLVSRQSAADGGAGGDASSIEASISADGRYVAFVSDANNLSTADDNSMNNAFWRDTQTDVTTLVSRQSAAGGGAGANGHAGFVSISGDGRYVAFDTDADNLSTIDDNSFQHVFSYDTQTDTIDLIDRQSDADGGAAADGNSSEPAISADGRNVAFLSGAGNLNTEDAIPTVDAYLRFVDPSPITPPTGGGGTSSTPAADPGSATPSTPSPARTCTSRRKFQITIRQTKSFRPVWAKITMGDKKIPVKRSGRLRATIDLSGMPLNRYSVKIKARTGDGRTLKGTRRYRTCTKGISSVRVSLP